MTKTYVSNGAQLSFHEIGSGLPVIFLHPTPLDHFYWLPMVGELGSVRAILPIFAVMEHPSWEKTCRAADSHAFPMRRC